MKGGVKLAQPRDQTRDLWRFISRRYHYSTGRQTEETKKAKLAQELKNFVLRFKLYIFLYEKTEKDKEARSCWNCLENVTFVFP